MSDFEDLPEDVRDELELRAATGQLQGVEGAEVQDYDAQHAAYVPRPPGADDAAAEEEDAALAALLARAEGGTRRGPGMRYYATCLRCGKSGHLARDCREPRPRRPRDPPSRARPPGVVRKRSSSSSSSSSDSSDDDEGTRREPVVVVASDSEKAEEAEEAKEAKGEVYCCNCGERGHDAAHCRRRRFDERDYDVSANRNRSIAWWKKSRSEAFIFGPRTPVEPALSPSPPPGFESALTGVRGGGGSSGSNNMRRTHSSGGGGGGGGTRHGFRSQPQFARTRSFVCGEDDDDDGSDRDDFEFHTDAPRGRRGGGSSSAGTPPLPQPASKRRRRHW